MMITKEDIGMLETLAKGVLAAPSATDEQIKRVQRLVNQGLARDYSAFHGTRMPVRLRIWGINDRGRAVIEQRILIENLKRDQPPLLLSRRKERNVDSRNPEELS